MRVLNLSPFLWQGERKPNISLTSQILFIINCLIILKIIISQYFDMQVLKIVWVHCSMVRVNLIFKRDLGAILIWQPKERRYVAVINTDFVMEVLQTLSKKTTATATKTWQNKRSEQWPCTCVLKLCTFLSRP